MRASRGTASEERRFAPMLFGQGFVVEVSGPAVRKLAVGRQVAKTFRFRDVRIPLSTKLQNLVSMNVEHIVGASLRGRPTDRHETLSFLVTATWGAH